MQHPLKHPFNAHAAPLKSPIAPPRHALRASLGASLVLMAELCSAHLIAATVPTEWTVRIGPRSASYQAERRHGDALDLRATLTYNGQPLAYNGPARLYAQTNGMGSAWWDLAPCTVSSNVLQATWLPSFDTGADVVDLFLGGPSNYQAAARIRFLPSPGSTPNALPLPVPVLDFSTVIITNSPFALSSDVDYSKSNTQLVATIETTALPRSYTEDGENVTLEFAFGPGGFTFVPSSMWTQTAYVDNLYIVSDDTNGPLSALVQYGGNFSNARAEMVDYVSGVVSTKQDALPYPTNAIPYAAITGAPTPPSVFYDAAGGAASVSGTTLTYQAASNSVGFVSLPAGTNVLHISAPAAITGRVRDFGLTVTTEDAATITLDSSVSWRFDAASTNIAAGSWNRVYCTESPSGVFSLQLWTPDSAQEVTP